MVLGEVLRRRLYARSDTVLEMCGREEDSAIHFIDENGDGVNSDSSDDASPSSEQQIVITINQVIFMMMMLMKTKMTIVMMVMKKTMMTIAMMTIPQKNELNSIVASRSGTPCQPMVNHQHRSQSQSKVYTISIVHNPKV